jgi:hypothetical protein
MMVGWIEPPMWVWLSFATTALFSITVIMAREANKNSEAALNASSRSLETLIKTERPYITGGGGFSFRTVGFRRPPGATIGIPVEQKVFVVDVQNNGKTPALLTHYDVQFRTF